MSPDGTHRFGGASVSYEDGQTLTNLKPLARRCTPAHGGSGPRRNLPHQALACWSRFQGSSAAHPKSQNCMEKWSLVRGNYNGRSGLVGNTSYIDPKAKSYTGTTTTIPLRVLCNCREEQNGDCGHGHLDSTILTRSGTQWAMPAKRPPRCPSTCLGTVGMWWPRALSMTRHFPIVI